MRRGEKSSTLHGVFDYKKRNLVAYITFNSPWGRQACLHAYSGGVVSSLLRPASARLRGAPLKAGYAPPPSTIFWENLGFSHANIFLRQV